MNALLTASRHPFLLAIASMGLIGTGVTAPKPVTRAESSHHRLVQNVSNMQEFRVETFQPDIEIPTFNIPDFHNLPPRDAGRGNLRWSASDQNGISDQVAISEDGSIVAIGYSLNNERLEVRSAVTGDTLFTFRVESGGSYVALSANGEIIAYSAVDSVWLFRSNQRGIPFFRFGMGGYYAGPVALSSSGDRLIATGSDPQEETNRAWGFNTANGVRLWTLDVDADESFGWYGARISADGSTAVVNGKYHLYVVEAQNGEVIWESPTFNTESPVEISGDGRIIATGTLSGRLRIFGRSEQAYDELWHFTFTGATASWITSLALARDGRTVAAGTLDFFADHYEGRLALFDVIGIGEPLWISDSHSDEISGIALSNDGAIVAAASWGDIDHEHPDVVVHEKHNRDPFYRLATDGSLTGIKISGNGGRIITGGKATHNRVFGRGGQAHLIDLNLLGGFVSGRVVSRQQQAIAGVTIGAEGSPYTTLTDAQGNYTLRIETNDQRNFIVFAAKRGIGRLERLALVSPDETTTGINFTFGDDLVGNPPVSLNASQDRRNEIVLRWEPYNGRRSAREINEVNGIRTIIGDSPLVPGATPWDEMGPVLGQPGRDEGDDALQINIYRSPLSGGPYTLIDSVDGDLGIFTDRHSVFPRHRYYYRVTATFENGESDFSSEAFGLLDDRYLVWDADLRSLPQTPHLDGAISAMEWSGAEFRDISDVFGYDMPDTAGSVLAWLAFCDQDDRLYIAVRYENTSELELNTGLGIYVDDDGDGKWSVRRPGSEGNYWGYYREAGPDMRFRSLSGGANTADPYFRFENPTLAFGESDGGVEVEMSIPLGFHGPQEIAVFAPERTIGLGLFAMLRDENGNPIFNGWWPQDMISIVTEPDQFARVQLPVNLVVPPLAPNGLQVGRDGNEMRLNWQDPLIAMDSAAIRSWNGVNIYRNGQFHATVAPGREIFRDRDFRPWIDRGGWYEYSLAGYVLEGQTPFEGPRSSTVGAYLGEEPQIREINYDDNSAEGFYVVAFGGEDNRFAVKFDVEAGTQDIACYWVEYYYRGEQPIDIWCSIDDGGSPAEEGTHFRVAPSGGEGLKRFHFPRREQPWFEFDPEFGGSFWVVLNYLPESPGGPAIGIDLSTVDGARNLYYTAASGWRALELGQPMIRAGIGAPVVGVEDDEAALPTNFEVLGNFPNPFNGWTILSVRLPQASPLKITLSDLQGRVVYRSETGLLIPGEHTIPIDAGALSSGIYIANVIADGNNRRHIIHLLK